MARIKTVFSPDQLIHVWAQEKQANGTTPRPGGYGPWGAAAQSRNKPSLYFEGPTLYSYGEHYVAGHFFWSANGERVAVINSEKSSVTTSKHTNKARFAVKGKCFRAAIPTAVIKYLRGSRDKHNYIAALADLKCMTENRIDVTVKLSVPIATHAIHIHHEWIEWCSQLGAVAPGSRKLSAAHECYLLDAHTLLRKNEARQAPLRAKREARHALQVAESNRLAALSWDEKKAEWQAGYNIYLPYVDGKPTLVRRRGNIVQTSRGAEVPYDKAIMLFEICSRVRSGNESIKSRAIGTRIGHFTIDAIDAEGNAKVGCHLLQYAEMGRLAQAEGLPTVP